MEDGEGRLILVWGERTESERTESEWLALNDHYLMRVTTLWSSSFDLERGWSEPTVVHRPDWPLFWAALEFTSAARDSRDRLHLFATGLGRTEPTVHLVHERGQWRRDVASPLDPLVLHHAPASAGGTLHLVALRRDLDSARREFFYSSLEEDAEGWTEPSVLPLDAASTAQDPILLVDHQEKLHLIWSEGRSERAGAPVPHFGLRHAILGRADQIDDRGWIEGVDDVGEFRAFASRCGALSLVMNGRGPGLASLTRDPGSGEWGPPVRLQPEWTVNDFSLGRTSSGDIRGVAVGWPGDGAQQGLPSAVFRFHCERC